MSEKQRFEITDYGSEYYIEIIDNKKELERDDEMNEKQFEDDGVEYFILCLILITNMMVKKYLNGINTQVMQNIPTLKELQKY